MTSSFRIRETTHGLPKEWGDLLHSWGLAGYLDRWDPAVDGDSVELEIHLRSVIRDTPCILAVVTENTPLSWWVPFELGVARETNSQIATFLLVIEDSGRQVDLPSYLRKWPILASGTELRELGRCHGIFEAGIFHRPNQFRVLPDVCRLLWSEGNRQADKFAEGTVRQLMHINGGAKTCQQGGVPPKNELPGEGCARVYPLASQASSRTSIGWRRLPRLW